MVKNIIFEEEEEQEEVHKNKNTKSYSKVAFEDCETVEVSLHDVKVQSVDYHHQFVAESRLVASKKRIKRGKFNYEREIDLHGYTVEIAEQKAMSFLKECAAQYIKCVLIITGKGLHSQSQIPVVKNAIIELIKNNTELVASYKSAPLKHGGDGALLINLK